MHNIKLNPIEAESDGELSEVIYYECQFCQKTVGLYPDQRKLCEKLSGKNFYCSYCLQNGLNTRNNQHILMMSFKGIIGYYYYILHATNKKLYQSQIMDYIESHRQAGLQNPVFRYDPQSFVWFVDFSKVGRGNKKISVNDVLKTTINILVCFEAPTHIPHFCTSRIYDKYKEAIIKFYMERYRPKNKKILLPTLAGCGGPCDNKNINFDETKNFRRLSIY